MGKSRRDSPLTLAYVVVGLTAAIAVGYFTLHDKFFHLPMPMLPFVAVGLAGALIYATVQLRRAGLAILMIGLLYLIQVAMTPPIRTATLAAGAIFALPVGFALLAGSHAQTALARFRIGRFIVMGAVLAAGYAVMMFLFLVRSHLDLNLSLVLRQAFVGLELGAAMGLGFELVELLAPRLRQRPAGERPRA